MVSLGYGYWCSTTHPNKPSPGSQPDALSLPILFEALTSVFSPCGPQNSTFVWGRGMCFEQPVVSMSAVKSLSVTEVNLKV